MIYMQNNYWDFLKLRDKINLLKHKKPITTPKNFIALILKEKQRVLDIGAGDKRLLKYLANNGFKGEYKSCDTDKTMTQDFYSIEDVTGNYDAITMIEILEHVPLTEAIPFIEKAINKLQLGGQLIITVPNVNCIGAMEQMDITHIQHYPVNDLCAVLRMLGLKNEFEYYRVYMKYFFGVSGVREVINKFLRRLICIEYCPGIILLAKK